MELCSMLCGSLDGRRVWGRMDTQVCTAECLHCSPETITTLSVNWLYQIQIKSKKKSEISLKNLGIPIAGVKNRTGF